MQIFKEFKRDKWAAFCLYLAAFIFLAFQSLGFFIARSGADTPGISLKILLAVFVISLLLALPLALLGLRALRWDGLRRFIAPAQGGRKLPWLLIFALLMLFWLPCFLAFYPGIMAYDIGYQWKIFIENRLTTHHPLIHTLFAGGFFKLGQSLFGSYDIGIALHCLVQLIIQAAAVSCGIYQMQSFRLPRWVFILACLFYALFPIFPLLGISTTKDVLFSSFFLLAIICAINMSMSRGGRLQPLLFILALVFSMLLRNNAVYAALAVCLVVLLLLIKLRPRAFSLRIIACILAAILTAQLSASALQKATGAEDGSPVEMMSVPLQQLARVYNYEYNLISEEDEESFQQFFRMDWITHYRPFISDQAKGAFFVDSFRETPGEFVRLWLDMGLRFPLVYVDAFLYNTIPLWYIGDESILDIKRCYLELDFYQIDESSAPAGLLPGLENIYRNLAGVGTLRNIPILSVLTSVAVYTWLMFMAFALLLARRRYELLFIPLLPLMYLATLLLGPCILPRYCLVAIISMPLILAWLIHLANTKTYTGEE